MKRRDMLTTHQNDFVRLEIRDWLLYCTYFSTYKITIREARQIVKERLEFTGDRAYPVIIFGQGLVQMNWDARKYLSSREGTRGLTAAAIVVNSPTTQMLGNFVIKSISSHFEARLFTSEKKAIQWLARFT